MYKECDHIITDCVSSCVGGWLDLKIAQWTIRLLCWNERCFELYFYLKLRHKHNALYPLGWICILLNTGIKLVISFFFGIPWCGYNLSSTLCFFWHPRYFHCGPPGFLCVLVFPRNRPKFAFPFWAMGSYCSGDMVISLCPLFQPFPMLQLFMLGLSLKVN